MRSFERGEVENLQSYIRKDKVAPSIRELEELYKNKENLKFLIAVLNKLEEFKKLSDVLYENFKFFEGKSRVNLFEQIVTGEFNIPNAILAYILLNGLIKELEEKKIIRILRYVRNHIHYQEAKFLKRGEIDFSWSVDSKDISRLLNLYIPLTNNLEKSLKKLEHEYNKFEIVEGKEELRKKLEKLEDLDYLKGDLRFLMNLNLSFLKTKAEKIEFYYFILIRKKLFELKNSVIPRVLLSISNTLNRSSKTYFKDHYAEWIGAISLREETYFGNKFFFGEKGKWEIFLARIPNPKNDKHQIQTVFEEFFSLFVSKEVKEKINNDNKIEEILKEEIKKKLALKEQNKKDWKYYFLKYPIILTPLETKCTKVSYRNLFGWIIKKDKRSRRSKTINTGHIEKLASHKRLTKTSPRINVFILALLDSLGIKDFEDIKINKKTYISYYQTRNLTIKTMPLKLVVKKGEIEKKFPLFEEIDAIEEAKRFIERS